MDASTEFLFLQELRFLTQAGIIRGEKLLELASAWAHDDAAQRSLLSHQHDGSFEERERTTRESTRLAQEQVYTQGDFFSELDAFLALYGRTALVLFPQGERSNAARRDRAESLRKALDIDRTHQIADRQLRNGWMHVDEKIDEFARDGTQHRILQRFVRSDRLLEEHIETTLRLVVLDELRVIYRGIGDFSISELVEALRDLEERSKTAIDTWGDRWAHEF